VCALLVSEASYEKMDHQASQLDSDFEGADSAGVNEDVDVNSGLGGMYSQQLYVYLPLLVVPT
jgi:hypothetical protein